MFEMGCNSEKYQFLIDIKYLGIGRKGKKILNIKF